VNDGEQGILLQELARGGAYGETTRGTLASMLDALLYFLALRICWNSLQLSGSKEKRSTHEAAEEFLLLHGPV
jgi:hypothetical protein